jgi:alpha-tubulin suppressor-like RCC1 family protein
VQLDAGRKHVCALAEDGTPVCWGGNSNNQVTNTPSGVSFKLITTGGYHSCGVKEDNTVVCWGKSPAIASTPTTAAVQLASGQNHNCILQSNTDNTAACWGLNTNGCTTAPTAAFAEGTPAMPTAAPTASPTEANCELSKDIPSSCNIGHKSSSTAEGCAPACSDGTYTGCAAWTWNIYQLPGSGIDGAW